MLAIRASHAFDGTDFLPGGATIVVDGEQIVSVGPADQPVPDGCDVTSYDGTLLPGLFDAHVHLVADGALGSLERAGVLPLEEVDAQIERSLIAQAARGVTTVRDLGDRDYRTLAFRDRRTPGHPRILAAGPPITIPGGHCHFLGSTAGTADELMAEVAHHHEMGVDVIKVMASGGFLTEGTDMFGAHYGAGDLAILVEAAHAVGLRVLAHAHSIAGIEVAIAAGVDGIEHFSGISEGGNVIADDLLERVAAAGVEVDLTMGFDQTLIAMMPPPPPQMVATMERTGVDFGGMLVRQYEVAARMRAHGITLVNGVDSGAMPLKAHGNAWIAVVDLVRAGYPVAEALAAGTSGSAAACGVADVTGRLVPGLSADIIVADGDLAADPTGLGRLQAVLVRGHRI